MIDRGVDLCLIHLRQMRWLAGLIIHAFMISNLDVILRITLFFFILFFFQSILSLI